MPEVSLTPIQMLDATLLFPTDDYAASCSAIALTPSPGPVWNGLKPDAVHQGRARWTLDLTFAQDHETATSLSTYLLANEGATVAVTFTPANLGKDLEAGQAFEAAAVVTFKTDTAGAPAVRQTIVFKAFVI